jgi:hypothetical protein
MKNRSELLRVLLVSFGVALLTLIPYLFSSQIVSSDGIFSGFLLNPIDGFSYLAKMRQGTEGAWLSTLQYAPEPGEGAILFAYYVFLGHLVKWTGLPALVIYHGARMIGAFLMNLAGYGLLKQIFEENRPRWMAYILFLVGSGFGWLGLIFGYLPTDLWIPESIPFLSAYTNPHFPLAIALFLLILALALVKELSPARRLFIAVVLSTLLAILQPFGVVVLGLSLLVWSLFESWRTYKENRTIRFREPGWVVGIGIAIGSLPWLVYDGLLILNHPVLKEWNAQNLTPSPPLVDYLFGFGGVLILALVALFRREVYSSAKLRFVIFWMVLQSMLLYAPLGLQRRFSLGLYFSLVILTVVAIGGIGTRQRRRMAMIGLILLSIPSNIVVIASGMAGVASQDPARVLSADEYAAYAWLKDHGDSQALVLTGYRTGNRVPAYANLRVLYGHPFETPQAESQKELIAGLFKDRREYSEVLKDLQALDVRYILYGPEEKDLGDAIWLAELPPIARFGEYAVFEINPR